MGAWLLLWLLCLLIWGLFFLKSTSFVVDGERHFVLIDDAMISMTYARNLLDGYGLDWSRRGERVEGFTHPLWLVLLVVAQALPVELAKKCLAVQIAGLLCWLLVVPAVVRVAHRHFRFERAAGLAAAAVLSGGSYALAHWSILGMETGLQALLLVLLAGSALDLADSTVANSSRKGIRLGAIAAVLYLLRMDMLVPISVTLVWAALAAPRRQEVRRALVRALSLLALSAIGLQVARWAVFGEVLPNTYFLKLQGIPLQLRLARGLVSTLEYLSETSLFWVAAAVGCYLCRRREGTWLLASMASSSIAYSIWIGGDVWDWMDHVGANRFVAPVLPLVAILAAATAARLTQALEHRTPSILIRGAVAALWTLLLTLSANGLLWGEKAPQLRARAFLGERPGQAVSNELVYRQLREFRRLVRAPATVVTIWAGIPAYFSEYRMVDAFGYSDRRVARSAPHLDRFDTSMPQLYTPGHVKWDFEFVVAALQPDAFFQAWGPPPSELSSLMRRSGFRRAGEFWLRPGSPFLTRKGRQALRHEKSRAAPTS